MNYNASVVHSKYTGVLRFDGAAPVAAWPYNGCLQFLIIDMVGPKSLLRSIEVRTTE